MSIRTHLNRHPVWAGVIAVLAVALSAFSVFQYLRPEAPIPPGPRKDFYTVDDGETWFVDDADKVTPFDHNGRPAVVAHVFTCDGSKTTFLGYLEKLPEGAAEQYRARTGMPKSTAPEADDVAEMLGSLVKRKGETEWVASSDAERFRRIVEVHCPGGDATAGRVVPQ